MKRHVQKTWALVEDHDTRRVDGDVTAEDDPRFDIERARTAKGIRLVAATLPPKDDALSDEMMRDWDSVSSRKRKRVAAAIDAPLHREETRAKAWRVLEPESEIGDAVRKLDLDDSDVIDDDFTETAS